jgi:hypothetical protein
VVVQHARENEIGCAEQHRPNSLERISSSSRSTFRDDFGHGDDYDETKRKTIQDLIRSSSSSSSSSGCSGGVEQQQQQQQGVGGGRFGERGSSSNSPRGAPSELFISPRGSGHCFSSNGDDEDANGDEPFLSSSSYNAIEKSSNTRSLSSSSSVSPDLSNTGANADASPMLESAGLGAYIPALQEVVVVVVVGGGGGEVRFKFRYKLASIVLQVNANCVHSVRYCCREKCTFSVCVCVFCFLFF